MMARPQIINLTPRMSRSAWLASRETVQLSTKLLG